MARWTDNGTRLDLGAQFVMSVVKEQGGWCWYLTGPGGVAFGSRLKDTAARARSAAVSWLRRALKQASKRLEAK